MKYTHTHTHTHCGHVWQGCTVCAVYASSEEGVLTFLLHASHFTSVRGIKVSLTVVPQCEQLQSASELLACVDKPPHYVSDPRGVWCDRRRLYLYVGLHVSFKVIIQ